jgi:LysM domain
VEGPAAPAPSQAPAEDASAATALPTEAATTDAAPAAEAAPMEAAPAEAASAAAPEPAAQPAPAPELGAIGYDSQGRQGRIHVVKRGDTLWDISETYLGTPWVWPSIWKDNDKIANPHLIYPGDLIWISATEMRRVTREEADALLANGPPPGAPAPVVAEQPTETPVMPAAPSVPSERQTVHVSFRESTGLISEEQLQAAASIVDRVPGRVLLSQEDEVYIGLGESDVHKGDQFTIFRTNQKVFDPDTGALLGYQIEVLGWLEVEQTYPEASLAKIMMSSSDIERDDRLMPREPVDLDVPVQESPQGVEGKITFFPQRRVLMGMNDFVYLNRGTLDGLEVGSPLEVYRPGHSQMDTARGDRVDVPDRVIGKLLVVRANSDASVALVTQSETELALGDRFRGAGM